MKRFPRLRGRLIAPLSLLAVVACGKGASGPESGAIAAPVVVVAEPPVAGIVAAEAADFERLYPENRIRVETGGAREAMSALFGARAGLAVVGRELSPEERSAARRSGLGIEATRWARDGLAIVVHPSNPIQQIAFDDLREIFSGKTVSWAAFGGSNRRIVPVVQSTETGATQYFADQVMGDAGFAGPAVVVADDSAAAQRVAADPGAIGFVSLPYADRGVRALRVSSVKGMPYIDLDARTVYEHRYPLTRFYNLVRRTPGPPAADDFNTYLCAEEGQRRVLAAGLVPATVPVKFTSRAPTLPSH